MTNVQLLCSTYRLANSGVRVAQALVFCGVVSGAIFVLLSMSLCCLSRLAAASDKVYQLLAHGQWFSPGTPVSSTTKSGRHDIQMI
jgi:hypothetical protein